MKCFVFHYRAEYFMPFNDSEEEHNTGPRADWNPEFYGL